MYDVKPWERIASESTKSYEAFCLYRDMGNERSLAKVATKLGKSAGLIERWSRRDNWVNRVAAWDSEQDRIEQEILRQENIKAIKRMRERHATLAESMLEKAAAALEMFPEVLIKPQDISRMVAVASKLERLARGDVSEVIEERDGGRVSPVQFYIPDNHRDEEEELEEDEEY